MTSRFDADTALDAADRGVFRGRIDRGWWVAQGPNGGYLAAMFLRGFQESVIDVDRVPRSLTVHYVQRPEEGPAQLTTQVERRGGSFTFVSGRLAQEDALVAVGLAAFSRLGAGPEFQDVEPPRVPPPSACLPLQPSGEAPPIFGQYEYRPALGHLPYAGGDRAEAGGWIRLRERRVVDHLVVAALTDAWFPAVFSRVAEPVAAPTIDLTVHFRTPLPLPDARDDEFVLGRFRSRLAAGGLVEEDGELWSEDGHLLAQSRQLALLRSIPTGTQAGNARHGADVE